MRLKKDDIFKLFKDWNENTSKDIRKARLDILPEIWNRAKEINSKHFSSVDKSILVAIQSEDLNQAVQVGVLRSIKFLIIKSSDVLGLIEEKNIKCINGVKTLLGGSFTEGLDKFIGVDMSFLSFIDSSDTSDYTVIYPGRGLVYIKDIMKGDYESVIQQWFDDDIFCDLLIQYYTSLVIGYDKFFRMVNYISDTPMSFINNNNKHLYEYIEKTIKV